MGEVKWKLLETVTVIRSKGVYTINTLAIHDNSKAIMRKSCNHDKFSVNKMPT